MKRILCMISTLAMLLTLAACSTPVTSNGTKEELNTVLTDIGRLPLSTPGISDEALLVVADLLDWCQATTMTSADVQAAVKTYYASLKNEDVRTQFYEQLEFAVQIARQVQEPTVREERLNAVGIKVSEHTWEDKAFTLALSFTAMIEKPPVDMSEKTFTAGVLKVTSSFLIVDALDGEKALTDANQTMVSGADYPDGVKEGDVIRITYTGDVISGEPAQVVTAVSMTFATETFDAQVLEVYDSSLLVKPLEGEDELRSADQISVSGTALPDGVKVGDHVTIVYGGEIAESYPAQIHSASSITITK